MELLKVSIEPMCTCFMNGCTCIYILYCGITIADLLIAIHLIVGYPHVAMWIVLQPEGPFAIVVSLLMGNRS